MPYLSGTKLVDDVRHYRYVKIRSNNDKILTFWRCVIRKTCRTGCTTNYSESSQLRISSRSSQSHTHASEESEIKVDDVVRGIKRKALSQPNEQPIKIIQQELAAVDDPEFLVKMHT